MSLYLFLPTAAQRVQVEEFKQAFQQAGEDTINGSCGLTRFSMLRRLAFLSGAGSAGPRTGQSPLFHLLGGRRQAACRYH